MTLVIVAARSDAFIAKNALFVNDEGRSTRLSFAFVKGYIVQAAIVGGDAAVRVS